MHVHPSGTIDYLIASKKRGSSVLYVATGIIKTDPAHPDIQTGIRQAEDCEIIAMPYGDGAFKVSVSAPVQDRAEKMLYSLTGFGDFVPQKKLRLQKVNEELGATVQ